MGAVKKTYDLYGVFADDIEDARSLVEQVLGITLQPHESGYRGGLYFRLHDVGKEHFILQRNFDAHEEEWLEPEHTEMPFILYVNETSRSRELQDALGAQHHFRLLRHQIL